MTRERLFKVNDFVEVHFYNGLAPERVKLVGWIDSFEKSIFSDDEAVCVSVHPAYSHLISYNPVTVLGDRLSHPGGEPGINDPLNYL